MSLICQAAQFKTQWGSTALNSVCPRLPTRWSIRLGASDRKARGTASAVGLARPQAFMGKSGLAGLRLALPASTPIHQDRHRLGLADTKMICAARCLLARHEHCLTAVHRSIATLSRRRNEWPGLIRGKSETQHSCELQETTLRKPAWILGSETY